MDPSKLSERELEKLTRKLVQASLGSRDLRVAGCPPHMLLMTRKLGQSNGAPVVPHHSLMQCAAHQHAGCSCSVQRAEGEPARKLVQAG